MDIILETKDLTKTYKAGGNHINAVDHTSICVERGDFVTIVGKSGSGKSTLLHLIGGLDYPTSGEVWIDNECITNMNEEDLSAFRRRKIGFIFQAFNLVPSLNVWENIILPIGLDDRKPDMVYLKEIIELLGLSEKLNTLPNTLSGGQQQRVAIARALATKPAIVLADEPTGNLDSKTSDEVMALLKTSAMKYEQTLIVITHNEDLNKTRLEREIDSLPADAKYRERKLHDMTLRLDSLYDVIVELEEKIEDARLRRDAIKQQAITLENIYKIMVNFDCVYNIINDEEKRNVVTALIKEIEIYRNDESEYPLKRIGLNFPVFKDGGEVTELLWDKGNTVEAIVSLQRGI